MSVLKDQKKFFATYAQKEKPAIDKKTIFYQFGLDSIVPHFKWLSDKTTLLEYGCGTGRTLELFLEITGKSNKKIIGVDLTPETIEVISKKYPNYFFYTIKENTISQLKDSEVAGCYLVNVLHHARDHKKIFEEINRILSKDGKFFIQDLSSNNPIIRLGRWAFGYMPRFVKSRFADDLSIDGDIPEKYSVDLMLTIQLLEESGFEIVKIDYSGLFVFVFEWFDRVLGLSRITLFSRFFQLLMRIEVFLLKYNLFNKRSEAFYIRCIKK